ncbi:DUF1501 domain-containing protein [Singulisphaera sp. PoT]|uniref:DUF1501 domain-containing protein n=1 Tax=Singulisphaera sp. PoT TaxID=3411797 RepID=UPI003BF4BBDC
MERYQHKLSSTAWVNRRTFLRVGSLGLASLARPGIFGAETLQALKARAVIQICLNGGPSHLDTYDPKPDAPVEFRGEFGSIATRVPGIRLCEHFPKQAALMDKLAVIRSLHHGSADHAGGMHWMMSGFAPIEPTPRVNERPSLGSIVARSSRSKPAGMPAYVGIPEAPAFGQAAYLGPAFNPLVTGGDPNRDAKPTNLELARGLTFDRLDDRRSLLSQLDRIERERDASGFMESMDRFTAEAYEMATGPRARQAFDLDKEDARTRDRYGRTSIGQACLLARRLVEAGTTFVAVTENGWDHHTEVFRQCRLKLPALDAAVAGLVSDLHDRGMLDEVLIIVGGEFGRTPRVNGSGGRDHWPDSMSVVLAGGGITTGLAVGATDRKGMRPIQRPLRPEDLLRTVYSVLGIDPDAAYPNDAGRPLPILNEGRPISELL